MIFRYLKQRKAKARIFCFADNNSYERDHCYGKKVLRPEKAERLCPNALWIISSLQYSSQMLVQLQKMRIDKSNILQISERDLREIYKASCKFWYDEDKYFLYEYGYPINFKFVSLWVRNIVMGKYYDSLARKTDSFHTADRTYKYNVSICGIFLNEAPYLREWIEFHRIVGVEHFYLYNNMSTDGYKDILEPYMEEGLVTLTDWNVPHGQISAYWDCVGRFAAESRWIGFIDLDEFVVPRENKIYDLLKPYDNRWGSVLIYGKIYGGCDGNDRDLNGLVTEDFKRCWPKLIAEGKCFYNTAYPLSGREKNGLGFYHVCWTKREDKDFRPVNIYGRVTMSGSPERATKQAVPAQINHYMIKSYKEYQKKVMRLDATFEFNLRRDDDYWEVDRKATGSNQLIEQYLPELKRRLGREGHANE